MNLHEVTRDDLDEGNDDDEDGDDTNEDEDDVEGGGWDISSTGPVRTRFEGLSKSSPPSTCSPSSSSELSCSSS